MRRFVVAALVVVVGVALIVAWMGGIGGGASEVRLSVEATRGDVAVAREGADQQIEAGFELRASDEVATGPGASADLSFGRGNTVRIGADTSVRVRTVDEDGVHLDLADGAIEATVRPGSGALRVGAGSQEVVTDDASFRVGRRGERVTVDVSRGEALVSGVAATDRVGPGERLRVIDGAATRGSIPDALLLSVQWPESPRTRADAVTVRGTTEPGARVRVDGSIRSIEVEAAEDGSFSALVPLDEGGNTLRVEARDEFGVVTHVSYTVERDTQGPAFQAGK